jgi:hypothetical protein
LFGPESERKMSKVERTRIRSLLKKEMQEIFECRNIFEQD